ncbi:MAG: hypothetical protein RIS53_467 [Bacillota bacterium]|jgi:thiamine pyrophosphokinase
MPNNVATIVLAQVNLKDIPLIQGDVVAVDKGCELLLKQKHNITYAVGDFDSILPIYFKKLESLKVPFQKFPKAKDQSDAELALNWTIKKGYDQIRIIGFSGGRLDHYQAIIQMLFRFRKKDITLLTSQQSIRFLDQGTYQLHQEKSERYFSVFTLSNAVVSIQDCLYPISKEKLTVKDTFALSNEWLNNREVKLTVHSGEILLYRTTLA